LIISPGANPIKPNMPGIDSKRVFTLRTVPDTEAIKKFVDTQKPKKAIIIGGGFIGLEMAENLVHKGVEITILEKAD
jgi:NADPH-dependent 2,4-dienoyl-CoA reductase/sulfur reductase-like enzyme